jgi:hypothetical protein
LRSRRVAAIVRRFTIQEYIYWQLVSASTWHTLYFPPGWLDG